MIENVSKIEEIEFSLEGYQTLIFGFHRGDCLVKYKRRVLRC